MKPHPIAYRVSERGSSRTSIGDLQALMCTEAQHTPLHFLFVFLFFVPSPIFSPIFLPLTPCHRPMVVHALLCHNAPPGNNTVRNHASWFENEALFRIHRFFHSSILLPEQLGLNSGWAHKCFSPCWAVF
ncbi:uncharacterized protein BDW43DRAFT_261780 [Aspergillus alliaceus]|uniref:uncharacterized protein n=1 Tax=Petromyces alliaceus TaxID=209559 RepID=UPI0012A4D146|nr:uncharacterized protein BDW43DRAFT_261780 [Aspergillus alliaceus]KAB8238483.1 hypothetical protein BDW43DRAFT_261780 [Aspergillus alliaceus]